MTVERDRAPIDQEWVQQYCDEFLKVIAEHKLDDQLNEAILRRVECVMDLLDAWQLRHVPFEERQRLRYEKPT